MKAGFLTAVALLTVGTGGRFLTAQQSAGSQTTPKAARVPVAELAALQVDFKNRIDHYLEIRRQAAKGAPPLSETKDPAKIKAAEETLAGRIQSLRSAAQPGEIFTPAIQKTIRQLLAPELKGGGGKDTRDVLKDDAPKSVPLKVNAKYPEKAALPTVPSNLLLTLPHLPEELEYRIVGRNLILRDTGADLIVDFVPNAIQ